MKHVCMRIPADLRKAVALAAARRGVSKTSLWVEAMWLYLKNGGKK